MNILIVDPVISTDFIITELSKKNDVFILDTLGSKLNSEFFKLDINKLKSLSTYIKSAGNLAADCALIKDHNIDSVLYGSEFTIEYTDKLARMLCIPFNNHETSDLRFDKYHMINIMKESKQICFDGNLNRCMDFYNENNGNVVVKPRYNSTGSSDVFIPNNESSFLEKLKIINNSFLIQEKIFFKDEYFVDTASYGGVHVVCNIGFYEKKIINGNAVYQKASFLSKLDPLFKKISIYVENVLNIICFSFGLTHTEVALKDNGDLVLIEVNPRVSGVKGFMNKATQNMYGYNQISVYLNLLNKNKLVSEIYTIPAKKQSEIIFIHKEDEYKKLLKKLPNENIFINTNYTFVEKEYTLFNCPGFFIHEVK
mgnify:CR=1 FL=1|tara:strand:- start:342 stop:1448 length:1107 start_codon:yes stop_codon:yes gene_type:complete